MFKQHKGKRSFIWRHSSKTTSVLSWMAMQADASETPRITQRLICKLSGKKGLSAIHKQVTLIKVQPISIRCYHWCPVNSTTERMILSSPREHNHNSPKKAKKQPRKTSTLKQESMVNTTNPCCLVTSPFALNDLSPPSPLAPPLPVFTPDLRTEYDTTVDRYYSIIRLSKSQH